MYRSIKIRIYPDEEQKQIIEQTLGACRKVYNMGLSMIHDAYFERGENVSYIQVSRFITQYSKTEEGSWLKGISRDAITQTLRDLNNAFQLFFKGQKRYPKEKDNYKRKKRAYRTRLNITQGKANKINIEKLSFVKGQRKFVLPDNCTGRVTIRKSGSGKYYMGIKYRVDDVKSEEKDYADNKVVGIDIGIKNLITTSDGEKIKAKTFMGRMTKRLTHAMKNYMRKPSDSHNHEKAVIRYNKLLEKCENQRKDFLHKLSHRFMSEYDEIHIEDISVREMTKKARSRPVRFKLSDIGIGEFIRQLKYKSEIYGVKLIVADKQFPSSQLCSNCGYRHEIVGKDPDIKTWTCPKCGSLHDRDLNAAINLKQYTPGCSY